MTLKSMPIEDEERVHIQIAYLLLKENAKKDKLLSDIDAFCREKLPEHAIPVKYVILEEMPLTKSGKVDYRKLEQIAETE